MRTPDRHKMALLTWLVVYPIITLLLAVSEPLLSDMALPLRTLILSLIMVPTMVYGAMPFVTARLNGWLTDRPKAGSPE